MILRAYIQCVLYTYEEKAPQHRSMAKRGRLKNEAAFGHVHQPTHQCVEEVLTPAVFLIRIVLGADLVFILLFFFLGRACVKPNSSGKNLFSSFFDEGTS